MVAEIARGGRAGSLGTGAALTLLLKHCPIDTSAFPPEWGVFESAAGFLTAVRREGAPAATVRFWGACAAFLSTELRRLSDVEFRAATFSRLLAQPGALAWTRLFSAAAPGPAPRSKPCCRCSCCQRFVGAGVLFDFVAIDTDPASIGTARVAALSVGDAALAYSSALIRNPAVFRPRIRALLSQQLDVFLSVGAPLSRLKGLPSIDSGARGAERAGPERPAHLPASLCALLCLPDASTCAADWLSAKPLVQHVLGAPRLRDVVRAVLWEAGTATAAAAEPCLAQLPVPAEPPPFIELLFGRRKSAEELGYAFALRAALKALAALAEWRAARAGVTAPATAALPATAVTAAAEVSSDEPPAKRVRPNPLASGSFEDDVFAFSEDSQVRVKVRDTNAREMRLKARPCCFARVSTSLC